jgi:hypothetical protein
MSAGRIIGYILAAIFIVFGALFVLAAFNPQGSPGYIVVGIILVGIGFGLIYFASRKPAGQAAADQNVTYKIDLPGNVNMESMKCKSCGGVITDKDISMVNGAPVVTCPYCHTVYQLTEDPKW